MNIFVITDNEFWLEKATQIFKEKEIDVDFYCSPKSEKLFLKQINSGEIKILDIKGDCEYLISNYQLGFSCHCKQIFPKKLVESVRCINIHPGLNPYNRGWFPQVFSIINKKPVGATIHLMDSEVDHGDILYQQEVKVFDWYVSRSIYERVLDAEYELFSRNFDELINADYKSKKMIVEGNYNSIKDYKSLIEIDLDKKTTMREAIDYLRAMTHPPYKNAYFQTENGKVYVSIVVEKEGLSYCVKSNDATDQEVYYQGTEHSCWAFVAQVGNENLKKSLVVIEVE